VGTQPVAGYCREIETYLCRKNDGHLIRVVGPSFDLVSGWAARGVPLKIAMEGIDRYFERYYRAGPRRRPVRIDFCEADVLDAFDQWRRAVGIVEPASADGGSRTDSKGPDGRCRSDAGHESLPAHLERAVARLTSARAGGALDNRFDALIDLVAGELDSARAVVGGVRGEARRSLVNRLATLDGELVHKAREQLEPSQLAALASAADLEIAPFRAAMAPETLLRARERAIDELVRQRYGLPTLTFKS
jgi:hypothetical protein